MNANDLKQVYGVLLSSPEMNVPVKIDVKINKRTVLLLSQVIDKGLNVKGDHPGNGMIEAANREELEELQKLSADCLEKAGLKEFSEKLMALSGK